MSQFYGTLNGNRGEATRCGSKASGIRTTAASWAGAVTVRLYERDGEERAAVYFDTWHGAGTYRPIYNGPVNPTDDQLFAVVAEMAKARLSVK